MTHMRIFLISVLALLGIAAAQTTELPFCTDSSVEPNTTTASTSTPPTPIYEIQGTELLSPYNGETVHTYGVVTATFYERNQIGGFFVQDPLGDDNPATSDAIFVRHRTGDLPNVGDFVEFTARVAERDHFTSAERVENLVVCGEFPLPEPAVLSLPVDDPYAFEAFEGMLITFEQPLVITELYDLGRYGRMVLADDRLFIPEQNASEQQHTPNHLRRIVLDDTFTTENISPTPYLNNDGRPPRTGDQVVHVVGVLASESGDVYRIEPTEPVVFEHTNPRPEAPAVRGTGDGTLVIAGFNAYNFFTDLYGRGPSSEEEQERQTAKLVAAITKMDADIIGFMEIENDAGMSMQRMVNAVNAALGTNEYDYVRTGKLGTDQIAQAAMYRKNVVQPRVIHALHDNAVHDRPPLGVVFERADGERVVVVVGHFKSKGSCPPAGDTDRGFGCWNLRRSAQAESVATFAEELGELAGTKNLVIIGDLNSYGNEPPITVLRNAGWIDLGQEWLAPEDRYSYVYMGEFGTLDYALVSEALAPHVTGFAYWHINADEPRAFDYSTEWNLPESFRPDEFRSSDHDPTLFGIQLPLLEH